MSDLTPKEPGFEYMAVVIRSRDKIRLVYGTDQEASMVREVIQQTWPKGLQKEDIKLGAVNDFKLKGFPFMEGSSSEDAANARSMACHLLQRFHNLGWKLITCSDLARLTDLTTLFFQRSSNEFSSYNFGCISLSSWDKLQVSFQSWPCYDAAFLFSHFLCLPDVRVALRAFYQRRRPTHVD